jgi:hypothetical protein
MWQLHGPDLLNFLLHVEKQQEKEDCLEPVKMIESTFLFPQIRVSQMLMKLQAFNPLTPELIPSSQRCLTKYFTGGFASWTVHFVNICKKYQQMQQLMCLVVWCTHHTTRHITPIHNILSTAPQLSISQKALGTLPEDVNVMTKHVGANS